MTDVCERTKASLRASTRIALCLAIGAASRVGVGGDYTGAGVSTRCEALSCLAALASPRKRQYKSVDHAC